MTFEQAAAIPQAGLLALQSLRGKARLGPGQTLLINGAGGGVGTFAIQLARLQGAGITAVDRGEKLEALRSLGALHAIACTRADFTRSGRRYDVILDVKSERSIFACARALNPGGIYVTVGGSMWRLLEALILGPWIALSRKKRIRILALKTNAGLADMRDLFEAGKITPVIDGHYTARETVKAFRYYGEGLHRGKLVVTWH